MANQSKVKVKEQLETSIEAFKLSSNEVLNEMGIPLKTAKSIKDVPRIVESFANKNPNPQVFAKNIDYATYEIREKIKWNSHMLLSLTKQKLNQGEKDLSENINNIQKGYRDKIREKLAVFRKKSKE